MTILVTDDLVADKVFPITRGMIWPAASVYIAYAYGEGYAELVMGNGEGKGIVKTNSSVLTLTAVLLLALEVVVSSHQMYPKGVTFKFGSVGPSIFLASYPIFGIKPPFQTLKTIFVVLREKPREVVVSSYGPMVSDGELYAHSLYRHQEVGTEG